MEQTMNANIKRVAAMGSVIALIFASGCASLDATVAYEDSAIGEATQGQDILQVLHNDSQLGGE
jgi:hypothetical protein